MSDYNHDRIDVLVVYVGLPAIRCRLIYGTAWVGQLRNQRKIPTLRWIILVDVIHEEIYTVNHIRRQINLQHIRRMPEGGRREAGIEQIQHLTVLPPDANLSINNYHRINVHRQNSWAIIRDDERRFNHSSSVTRTMNDWICAIAVYM